MPPYQSRWGCDARRHPGRLGQSKLDSWTGGMFECVRDRTGRARLVFISSRVELPGLDMLHVQCPALAKILGGANVRLKIPFLARTVRAR